jgi:CRP-like cAMP-binding protein
MSCHDIGNSNAFLLPRSFPHLKQQSGNALLRGTHEKQRILLGAFSAAVWLPARVALTELRYVSRCREKAFAFPHCGIFSLLAVMQDGKAIETAKVGREGVVGAMAALRQARTRVRAVVQLALTASTISITHFRIAVQKSNAIRDLCIDYNEVLLTQARVTAACNALHPLEKRFCRWVLQSADRSGDNRAAVTQESLAEMLRVRRTSVTKTANKVQSRGLISYSRGSITILAGPSLEQLSCECYQLCAISHKSLTQQSILCHGPSLSGLRGLNCTNEVCPI